MPGRILLVNPLGKKRRSVSARKTLAGRKKTGVRKSNPSRKKVRTMKRRTAAQKAATARLVALNRGRRKNPIRRKRRSVARAAAAPARRIRRRKNPIALHHRRVHRRRRNPIRVKGLLNSLVMPALTASTGALLLDVLWAKLPIPANLKAGSLQYITKGAGAVALAMVAEKTKIVNRQTAEALGVGALTVVLHDALRGVIKNMVPSLGIGEYVGGFGGLGYINAGWPAGTLDAPNTAAAPMMGEYVGEYMSGANYDSDGAYNDYYAR